MSINYLFVDIQFGKGKARNPQTTTMSIDGKKEEVFYRPVLGVKFCGECVDGCSHVTSTSENRPCLLHPQSCVDLVIVP